MNKEHLSTDVLVIGSGASAAPVAYSLAKAGMKVTVLEKGDFKPMDGLEEDELAQLHLEIYRPPAEIDPTVLLSSGATVATNSRVGQGFYLVGGGTLRYSGTSWRLRPQDFKKVTHYGTVKGTSLVDWPISYEDLEPYYTMAEQEIGISGVAGEDPTEPPRSKNVLMPPLRDDKFQLRLTAAAKKMGLKPFHIPVAIHSEPSAERGAGICQQCGWCSGFPCRFRAKSSVDVVIYPRAQASGNFFMRPLSYVTRLDTDDKGRASGAEFIDLKTGERHFIKAKIVVLAASAIQTARLLLLSENGKAPKGLANSSGLVGRNLSFHIECKASALFDEDYHQALYKKVGINDFYFPQKDAGFINHVSIQSGSKAPPIAFAMSRKGYGAMLQDELKKRFLRTQEIQCMAEDLPQHDNRVGLSNTVKDYWGLPAPEVHHTYHDMDRKALTFAASKICEILKAAGGVDIEQPKIHDNIGGRYTWHLMGTTRMGLDPASSVVNSDGRCHDIPNLFVVDGAVFPTSGGLNPTLTMQALSFRTADRIIALTKEGKL